jgi:hypothetical protein
MECEARIDGEELLILVVDKLKARRLWIDEGDFGQQSTIPDKLVMMQNTRQVSRLVKRSCVACWQSKLSLILKIKSTGSH